MIYGYAQVSTDGQSVAAQVASLRKHGAGQVFREGPNTRSVRRSDDFEADAIETQMRNKEELDKWLRGQWAERDRPLADNQRLGLSMAEIAAYSATRNAQEESPLIDLWVAILDEFISWESSLLSIIFHDQEADEHHNFNRSVVSLLITIISDSMAIRHLIIAGFDKSARTILRSTCEYTDVLIAIFDDPPLADEFTKTENSKEANRFWWRHLAKGKIEKKIRTAWNKQSASTTETLDFCNFNIELLAAVSHPSMGGGIISGLPFKTTYSDDGWLPAWGDKTEGSIYTICTYAAKIFPLLFLFRHFPFKEFEDDKIRGSVNYDDSNELHRHVLIGRRILVRLVILLLLSSDDDAEHFPRLTWPSWC